MKSKVKKYAKGMLTDSSGNPVRSGSGEPVRTRTDEEFAEDSKFGGYGKNMPKTKSYSMDDVKSGLGRLLGGKSSPSEDRPTSSGVDDYETMGKRAGATSPFSGPKEYISESIQEDTEKESPKGIASGFKSGESKFERNDNEVKMPVVKKKAVKKAPAKPASQSFPTRDRDRADQAFPLKTDDKKVPPLRKIGEAIMGTMENRPFRSSMYDKMKGRKAGGSVKMASGGKTSSASSRGDGIAQRGKTKGRIC
jgi:hypothetical protein